MLLVFTLLIAGFVLVVKGADWLVDGSSALAVRYRVPEIVIGLTIVAFGTSTPEFVVSFISSLQGKNDFAIGNILGSNIFNILGILGVAGLVFPLSVKKNTVWKEIPFSLIVTLVLFFLVNDAWFGSGSNELSLADGMILLFLFVIFLLYNFILVKVQSDNDYEVRPESVLKIIVLIAVGLGGLVFGGQLVVKNATAIAQFYHIPDKIIGLTILSIGTSLPELATSVIAAWKKKPDIAVGNVVGSNIFNILLILGFSSILKPIQYNLSFNTDFYYAIGGTVLLFLFMFCWSRHKIDRIEAGLFLMIYMIYMYFLLF